MKLDELEKLAKDALRDERKGDLDWHGHDIPQTVLKMIAVVRAAQPLTREHWPDGETPEFYREELRKSMAELEQD